MDWIAASVYLSDGRVLRVGGDEIDPENQPSGISWDTSNPGGFGSGSITLPRPENLYADDAKLFSHVVIYGPLGTVYEGFVNGVPQVGTNEIQLALSGWVTALDRHETFRQIFVDRDLGRWEGMSRARKLTLIAATYTGCEAPSVDADVSSGLPSLSCSLAANTVSPLCAGYYNAGAGVRVASVYYDMTSISVSTDRGELLFSSDDVHTVTQGSSDFLTGTNSTASGTFTATTPQRYLVVQMYGNSTPSATERVMTFRRLAVFGDHGLTKRGTAPDEGYYQSDVIGYAISQCPSLTYTAGESVETTSFVVPHLTFTDDTSLRSVVEQMTALGGNQNVANDWGVYEGREFYWRSPGTYGRTWHVRRDQVATSSSDGPDADRRVAGVKVNYTDGAGTSLSVGPPGSNSDYETTDLIDSDPDNPAFRIPGAFKSESVGITSQQGAINIGVMILNERNRLDWRGSVDVQGEATDENGNVFPASLIRAGDRIVISDSDDTTPRTIVSTSYSHETLTCSASVGAAPDSLESLLGQLAAVTDLIAE